MKTKLFLLMQFVALAVAGCFSSVPQYPSTEVVLASALPVSASATSIPSPVLTSTFTPQPTLAYDVQDEFVSLLTQNGGCSLPCLWGIVPGKTSWQEAATLLSPFVYNPRGLHNAVDLPPEFKYYSAPADKSYSVSILTTKDIPLNINTDFDVDHEGEVIRGRIGIEYWGAESNYLDKRLFWYSPTNIFKTHGLPDNIYLSIERGVYSLSIVYENLRAIIELSGYAEKNAAGRRVVCPNIGDGDIGSLTIAFASSLDPIDVKTMIGYPFWEGVPPFEEVTGMSINEFYDFMISGQQPACIEIPE